MFADVLTERNALVSHVYFPTSGLIALHTATIGRPSLAMVSSEGMVGASVAAGIATSEALIVVQGEGAAMRVHARRFRLLLKRSPTLQRQIHRHTVDLLRRASQTAVCTTFTARKRALPDVFWKRAIAQARGTWG